MIFRVRDKNFEKLGTIDHSTINLHNHKRNGKTMAYKIEFETGTAIPTLQNTFDSGFKRDLGGEEGEGKNELKLGGIGST